MYAEQINNEHIEKAQLSINSSPNSFQLTKHSREECTQMVDFLNSLINLDLYEETKLKGASKTKIEFNERFKALSKSQKDFINKWIKNERILCKLDANYWQDNYDWILSKENVYIPFHPLLSQRIWRSVEARLELAGRAIRFLDLKARQVAKSTHTRGRVLHRIMFFPDVICVIASDDDSDTRILSNMYINTLNKQPYWLRPHFYKMEAGSFYHFDNGSYIDLGYGTQKKLGMGTTPTVSHCSEIAKFKYFSESIIKTLVKAMHETIWTYQSFEGTAEGRDDDLHKFWLETVSGFERGTTSLYPLFVPYATRPDLYPTEAWMQGREGFSDWKPSLETLIHIKKAENYIKTTDYLADVMGRNYRMSKEMAFWYEITKEEHKRRNQLHIFLQEYPADPDEAFQHAGLSLYPIEILTYYGDKAHAKVPEVYKLIGDSNEINPLLFPTPDEIKRDGKRIDIRARWNPSIPASNFRLVEINFNGWGTFDPQNKFLIFEHPTPKSVYGTTVDTSDGLGIGVSDDTVIEIVKRGTIDYKSRQVCEFASAELSQQIMWPFLLSICTYFSPEVQLLLAIEIQKGYQLQDLMINKGWGNIYSRTSPDRGENQVAKLGFSTDRTTRPDMMSFLHAFIKGKWIEIFSVPLINELRDLKKIRTVSSILGITNEKVSGKKDNRVLALAILLYIFYKGEGVELEKANWAKRIENETSTLYFKTEDKFDLGRDEGSLIWTPSSNNDIISEEEILDNFDEFDFSSDFEIGY